jgi:hypothetical protein
LNRHRKNHFGDVAHTHVRFHIKVQRVAAYLAQHNILKVIVCLNRQALGLALRDHDFANARDVDRSEGVPTSRDVVVTFPEPRNPPQPVNVMASSANKMK